MRREIVEPHSLLGWMVDYRSRYVPLVEESRFSKALLGHCSWCAGLVLLELSFPLPLRGRVSFSCPQCENRLVGEVVLKDER